MTQPFDDRPIGLFDSGIGGLTVLKSLLDRLPTESFVYLGDTARLPYGSKSPQTIERYLLQNIDFLVRQNVKAIVVACNSASTVLLKSQTGLSDALSRGFPVPIYNVIEPGAAAGLEVSTALKIGVLGTKATVLANSYVRALKQLNPKVQVFQQACPLLVPLVEEGWENDPLTNLIVYRYVSPLISAGVDTLILGCTHYPVLRGNIEKATNHRVNLVDSSAAISELIQNDLARGRFGSSRKRITVRVMTTDVSVGFTEVAKRLMEPHLIEPLIEVDISPLAP